MRVTALMVLLLIAPMPARGAPAPAPATVPTTTAATTRPQDMEPIGDGSIRYLPPPGWNLAEKSDDRLHFIYRHRNGMDMMEIRVTTENRAIPDNMADRMAAIIGKGVRDGAKAAGRDFTLPPTVEKDDRFLLKMHDRMRGKDEGGEEEFIADRIQIYRVMGLNLVHVACVAITDDAADGDKVHAQAEEMLSGMRLTRGMHPVVFGRSQLRVTTPLDWKVTKADEANGLVATYTDPKNATHQIIVRSRVLPKDARTDEPKRDAFVTKMIDAERRIAPLKPDLADKEQPATAPAPTGMTYLRHLRVPVSQGGQKLIVDTRYFVVADTLISVRSVATESDAEIDKVTDELSASVKPARE